MDVSRSPTGSLSAAELKIFAGGPPAVLRQLLGLSSQNLLTRVRRAIFAGIMAWLPLLVLSFPQQMFFGGPGPRVLLSDVSVLARYLFAIPLLILAESYSATRLGKITMRFRVGGIVRERDNARFEEIVGSTRQLMNSRTAEVVTLVAVPSLLLLLVLRMPVSAFPDWHIGRGGTGPYSLMGWWHLFVSAPILIILVLGWLWRMTLWARLLLLISRLNLRLVPSHPDASGGLGFVSISLVAFSALGFALGTIVAGNVANKIIFEGAPLQGLGPVVIGLVVTVVSVISLPVFVFVPTLIQVKRAGSRSYGQLATDVGVRFEKKWLEEGAPPVNDDALEAADFSAMTDLYQIIDRAYKMRIVPIQLLSIATLAVATLLPFLPVVLVSIPADKILAWFAGLLFKG